MFITYNGSGSAAGTKVYLNGEKLDQNVEADGLNATIITDKPLRLGRRFNRPMVFKSMMFVFMTEN